MTFILSLYSESCAVEDIVQLIFHHSLYKQGMDLITKDLLLCEATDVSNLDIYSYITQMQTILLEYILQVLCRIASNFFVTTVFYFFLLMWLLMYKCKIQLCSVAV